MANTKDEAKERNDECLKELNEKDLEKVAGGQISHLQYLFKLNGEDYYQKILLAIHV